MSANTELEACAELIKEGTHRNVNRMLEWLICKMWINTAKQHAQECRRAVYMETLACCNKRLEREMSTRNRCSYSNCLLCKMCYNDTVFYNDQRNFMLALTGYIVQ